MRLLYNFVTKTFKQQEPQHNVNCLLSTLFNDDMLTTHIIRTRSAVMNFFKANKDNN